MKNIVCLYGGPGTGKSTTCAGIFYKLKMKHYNCEMNREYVKEWVWEGREIQPGDQPYFFAKMARREKIYMNQGVDFIITDSPLILTSFYGRKYDELEKRYDTSAMMLKNHHEISKSLGYKVEHYFLNRIKPYQESGRLQTEEESKEIDNELKLFLTDYGIKFTEIDADDNAVDNIINTLI